IKKEFTTDLFTIQAERLDAFERKKADKLFGGELTMAQSDVLDLLKEGKNLGVISKELDISRDVVRHKMSAMKKKGYRFIPEYTKTVNPKVIKYEVINNREKKIIERKE
ncbi:unnamed protein product, partial [marine sediment metagenome]